ncbi:MAG: DUF3526 domain-containing protein [Aquisalinus sp.]|nr:DUF3526 domain-containing protein [Aquisalinus sp.]
MDNIIRELRFSLRDPVVALTLLVGVLLSAFTVFSGLKEVDTERAQIERVKQMVDDDRTYALADQSDAGGAAYYAFHFTYAPPSDLAFAARGVRDDLPWKHRIRMLALEGQIYETDAGNPELSRIGKFDFAFFAAFLLPLLMILLLHDLKAAEVRNNRWAFLSATGGDGGRLLLSRAVLRAILLFACIITPFLAGVIVSTASLMSAVVVCAVIGLNLAFWLVLSLFTTSRIQSGPTAAALLLGAWFTLTVALPVGGKLMVEQSVPVPMGGEILLTQREAVNDAWDLPREATLKPFYERHPEWANAEPVSEGFDWYWYYAFQQVGDQTVESMSEALRDGVAERDKAMAMIALTSPPLLVDRVMSQLAMTDIAAFQSYDQCVRDFHAALRAFHYPMLFGGKEYSAEAMKELPTFRPCASNS